MKSRSNLILLISIVILGIFIGIQESIRAKTRTQIVDSVRLFNLDVNTLSSIEFKYTNSVVRCEKENGVWMAGDQGENMGRADEALIQRMVSGLNSMGKGTTITSKSLEVRGLDSSEYGFDQPIAEVTALDNQGRHRWLVGRKTPLGNMVYAQKNSSDEIYTISNKLLFIMPSNYDHLRDRILFPGEPAGVRRLEIRGSAGFIQFVKDPKMGWTMQQPIAAKSDLKEVEQFISTLYQFRIEDFIADNVSDFSVYGLHGVASQISVESGEGTSRMLVVGDDIPDRPGYVYARRADDTSVFSLPTQVSKLFTLPAERFLDARVISLPPEKISSIEISKGEEHLSLEMNPSSGWAISNPVVWPADTKAVEDFLVLWDNAVIVDFNVITNDISVEWNFEFGSVDAGVTNRIEVLSANGNRSGLLIRRADNSIFYQINLPVIPSNLINPLQYKNHEIWKLNKLDVNKISLLKGDQTKQVMERQEDQSFALTEGKAPLPLNQAAFDRLLMTLEHIETSEYIIHNPRDLEIYGLAQPALELHVSLSSSNDLGRVLLIGNETPNGFYSMVKGRDVVFYLDKLLINDLFPNLINERNSMDPLTE